MTGHVDIHAHVLPGIDDGPRTLDDALAMAQAAAAAGTTTIAATPHLRADFPDVHVHELAERCRRLRAALAEAGIDIGVVSGAETSLVWALDASHEQLVLASYGQRGQDLLVEPPGQPGVGLEQFLYELRLKGFRVTLAHPERAFELERNRDLARDLVQQGVLLQVNADSLLDRARGSRAGPIARWLCVEGLAHALASDGHRAHSWRPVGRLAEAVVVAGELAGPARAGWMAGPAPEAILAGTELPPAPALDTSRRGLFGRLRRS